MTFLDHPLVFSSIVAALLAVAFYLDALTWSERPEYVAISVALVWFVSVSTVLQVFRMIVLARRYEAMSRTNNIGLLETRPNVPVVVDDRPEPPDNFKRLPNLKVVDRLYASATRSVMFGDWPKTLTSDDVTKTINALLDYERATHDALSHLSRPEIAQVKLFLRQKGWAAPEGKTVALTTEGKEALRRMVGRQR